MPDIEIQHIVSCSSADKSNPAENLLKPNGSHKWKSAAAGEKSVSCVLQLVKSSQIHSIDIGNEGSAFIEVLVGKATAASDQDFEVLLVASAFMSPLESRNGTNRNAVRMFGPDKLNSVTACQMWDRVKVVCTQPFSKLQQYGLSFIKLHSPPGDENGEAKVKKFGAFTIKEDEDDVGDDIRVGSLFASRSVKDVSAKPPAPPQGAAAVRAASKLAEEHIKASPSSSTATAAKTRIASPTLSSPSSTTATAAKTRLAPSSSASRREEAASKADTDTEEEEEQHVPVKTPLHRQSTSISSVSSSSSARPEKSALKRTKTEPVTPSPAKAFTKLMEKVVFVLSGFQNPYRGELRDKALEMGAKYQPDWARGCTHLVCAFSNTPKYQQVAGKGKIVTKGWILDCYKQKKLLPWRNYRLGDADTPDESSEEEEEVRSQPKRQDRKTTPPPTPTHRITPSKEPKPSLKKNELSGGTLSRGGSDSGGDTEDELRKVRKEAEGTSSKDTKVPSKKEADPYGCSTDEDEPAVRDPSSQGTSVADDGSDSGLPDLPDFFTDKHFFFYGNFDAAQRRLLTRYIAAFNGEVEDYMSKKVNFVITAQKWDDNFDEAVTENPNLVFVKPAWITGCHDKNKLIPHQPYIVVP